MLYAPRIIFHYTQIRLISHAFEWEYGNTVYYLEIKSRHTSDELNVALILPSYLSLLPALDIYFQSERPIVICCLWETAFIINLP